MGQGCLGGRTDLLEEGRKVGQGCLGGRNDLLEEGRKVGRWGRDVWVAEMIY